jgi:hypothetical protein
VHGVSISALGVVRLSLIPARQEDQAKGLDGDFLVALTASDPEYLILREWLEHGSDVAVVMPPESNLIRLRNLADLQPLTLRRLDSDA